jgi:ADP-ribose pyrophosphatase YjhB (NUDIX family)
MQDMIRKIVEADTEAKAMDEANRKSAEEEKRKIPFCPSCGDWRFPRYNAAVVMVIFNEVKDRMLMVKQHHEEQYYLVAGYIDEGETAEHAVVREIREETGLEVRLDGFLGIFHNHNMIWSNGDAAHVISAMYTASIVSGEPSFKMIVSIRAFCSISVI